MVLMYKLLHTITKVSKIFNLYHVISSQLIITKRLDFFCLNFRNSSSNQYFYTPMTLHFLIPEDQLSNSIFISFYNTSEDITSLTSSLLQVIVILNSLSLHLYDIFPDFTGLFFLTYFTMVKSIPPNFLFNVTILASDINVSSRINKQENSIKVSKKSNGEQKYLVVYSFMCMRSSTSWLSSNRSQGSKFSHLGMTPSPIHLPNKRGLIKLKQRTFMSKSLCLKVYHPFH